METSENDLKALVYGIHLAGKVLDLRNTREKLKEMVMILNYNLYMLFFVINTNRLARRLASI